jgi:putative flippase GtrA
VATGHRLRDTQTGLRAFPAAMLPWLIRQAGDRYDYELVQLMHATRDGVELRSVQIETIYEDDNASSHFRPVIDSARIYAPLLLFLTSSFSAFLIDALMLVALVGLTGNLLLSVVGARLLSASVNFAINRRVIFRGSDRWQRAARRYVALVLALLSTNYLVLDSLMTIGTPLVVAKVIAETLLVAASYAVQATYVYGRTSPSRSVWPTSHAELLPRS